MDLLKMLKVRLQEENVKLALRTTLNVTVAVSALLVATSAFAQGGRGWHGGDGLSGHLGMYADYLDLTDAQQAQIKQTLRSERATLKPLLAQEQQSHKALKELAESGSFDEGKAQSLAAQESQTHIQLEVQRAKIASEVYGVLTADQKSKLAQLEAKRAARAAARKNSASTPASNQ